MNRVERRVRDLINPYSTAFAPSFPQAPNPGERVPCLGSAKPIACDATAGSDLDAVTGSGTMDRREDGTTQPRLLRRRVSPTDQW
jgi:hypothetical protein